MTTVNNNKTIVTTITMSVLWLPIIMQHHTITFGNDGRKGGDNRDGV